jgi:hypothetical protein
MQTQLHFRYGMVNLRFICASYRSLYLKSSLSLVEII